ncbi:hypothetical protein HPB52_015113 [Rhipicephalus sanguineus]|uniref:Uncharacterized protein n=1 Tax=Rhipicephalus sanguineus TaxID=34632 RepID=A0A9D4PWP3_RHISA|nr:hypothetical protein HPB52_015113 [Rhipicephalus sanguineus]
MPSSPKGPYDLETPYQGVQHLTSPVEEAETSEPQAKPNRSARKMNHVVRYTPSLLSIDEEARSSTEGSASRSSQRPVTAPKRSGRASVRQDTFIEPRNESVRICVEEAPDSSSSKILGRSLDAWASISAAFFAVLGLLVVCLGAVEAISPGNADRGGMFLLAGAMLFMISVVMCNVVRGPTRSAAVRIITEARPN